MSYEQKLNALNTESLKMRRLQSDLVLMFKISRACTAVDNRIINFRTDSHTKGDFEVFKPDFKINARAFLCMLVMSTVGMPCQIQLDVHHHSALLSVCCVHVLVILYRFYILNVISKCDFYTWATVSACQWHGSPSVIFMCLML